MLLFQKIFRAGALVLPVLLASACGQTIAPVEQTRTFQFTYSFETRPFSPEGGAADIFVPLPAAGEYQSVDRESITASVPGEISTEPVHGNRFWHAHIENPAGDPVTFTGIYTITRTAIEGRLAAQGPPGGDAADPSRYLEANARVAVGRHVEALAPIVAEVEALAEEDSQVAVSRAIFDWVVGNMEYKKVGIGWGNGDTYWACSERYGNCTDFHSMFISLARTLGIPARFEMGFPVPLDKPAGDIGGYHCWLQFHLEGRGWVPVDASEAAKHPERREALYASQPFDRVHFTTGRDLRLGAAHCDDPLNYFIYPYIEIAGVAAGEKPQMKFSYRG